MGEPSADSPNSPLWQRVRRGRNLVEVYCAMTERSCVDLTESVLVDAIGDLLILGSLYELNVDHVGAMAIGAARFGLSLNLEDNAA